LWARLARSREVVLTKDGRPGALLLEVKPDNLETVVSAVRRALFSDAVCLIRARAEVEGELDEVAIEKEIQASRELRSWSSIPMRAFLRLPAHLAVPW